MSFAKPEKSIADDLPHTPADAHPPLPCRKCGDHASRAVLGMYGGQCLRCFDAYCRQPQARLDFGRTQRGAA